MKKIKYLFLTALMGIALFASANTVSASTTPFTMSQMDVVCDPESVEAGGKTTCYIIGAPDNDGSVHGYVTQAYATENLKLDTAAVYKDIKNADAAFTHASSVSSGEGKFTEKANMPEKVKSFSCVYDSEKVNAVKKELNSKGRSEDVDYGCAVYYTEDSATADAFTSQIIKENNDPAIVKNPGYGIIGSYTVQLDANAKDELCGEFCVKVWRVPLKEQYSDYKTCASGSGANCTTETATGSERGGDYFCEEIHLKPKKTTPGNPDNGAFASYTILAAGALIAVSAVAMAKKNTKFNKI